MVKLSTNEKYIIQGRLSDGDDVKEIAKSIGRQARTVQQYIDGELEDLHNTVAKAQTEHILKEAEKLNVKQKEALKKTQGKKKRKPRNTQFLNETGGGNKGVAVSTEAASQLSDYFQQKYPKKTTRTVRGNLYDIDREEVIDYDD